MSAGLDVAAGLAGLASLGIHVVDVAWKIRGICTAIKDAPHEIEDLLQEAELFEAIIAEYSLRTPTSAASVLQEAAIRRCKRNFDLLYSDLRELGDGLTGKRRIWTSMKAVRKRERLQRLAAKVERSKTSLLHVGLLYYLQYAPSSAFSSPNTDTRYATADEHILTGREQPDLVSAGQSYDEACLRPYFEVCI